jgi:D-serine deaminase-like pyridoxal phosphate-dependent protein
MNYLPLPGTPLDELDTPCLFIDLPAMERNIRKMAAFVAERGITCRPHAKTPKCPVICLKQVEAGAIGVCVAKVGEAEALVAGGIRDVFITNEIVGPIKIARLMALCRTARMMVAVDDPANVAMLSQAAKKFGVDLRVAIDVNVRINRCGVEPGQPAVDLAEVVASSQGLVFSGLMGYEGTFRMPDFEQRMQETKKAIDKLIMTKEMVEKAGLQVEVVSAGSSSTWNITSTFAGVTEIQPGTYVLMDASYRQHTPDFENALFLLATVISRPAKGRAIIDVGLTGISTDEGLPEVEGPSGAKLHGLDQEHGHLTLEDDAEGLRPGDKVVILPRHGDTTINLHDYYFGIRNRVLESVFEITARGRFL